VGGGGELGGSSVVLRGPALDGRSPPGSGYEQIPGRIELVRNPASAQMAHVGGELVQELANVVELAIVEQ
jgi:hypothetical protein